MVAEQCVHGTDRIQHRFGIASGRNNLDKVLDKQPICRGSRLKNGADGIRFLVSSGDRVSPAFAVRHKNRVHAYINRCAHMELELDMVPGRFFDNKSRYLVCATHGARYQPATGRCVLGPCHGRYLQPIQVIELDHQLVLTDNQYRLARTCTEVVHER